MSNKKVIIRASDVLHAELLALIPTTKRPTGQALIDAYNEKYPSLTAKTDGRTTSWDEERRAKMIAKWAEKRAQETFYMYRVVNLERIEAIVQGATKVCTLLGIRETYLRNRINSSGGVASFGTGNAKITVSRTKLAHDPVAEFEQSFYAKKKRWPEEHEYPVVKPKFGHHKPKGSNRE